MREENEKRYWEVLMKLDPELYLVKVALEETKINPRMLPRIIRSIANVAYGTKTGRVKVFVERGVVTHIFGEERDKLNLDALDDEE
jgi:hypothetical protein